MIDLHTHLLAGIDDGPQTLEDALVLARVAAAAGTETMVTTPHVSGRYPNLRATIEAAFAELQPALEAAAIPIAIVPGAEVAMTQIDELPAGELEKLCLGGGNYVLLEAPFTLAIESFAALVSSLQSDGFGVVLAHPERCGGFHRRPDLLGTLAKQDVLMSVTAASLSGRFGREVERFALAMAHEGLLHVVASDAHDLEGRRPEIKTHLEQVGLAEVAELLTLAVPAAIIAGEQPVALPGPLPQATRSHRRWWRRLAGSGQT